MTQGKGQTIIDATKHKDKTDKKIEDKGIRKGRNERRKLKESETEEKKDLKESNKGKQSRFTGVYNESAVRKTKKTDVRHGLPQGSTNAASRLYKSKEENVIEGNSEFDDKFIENRRPFPSHQQPKGDLQHEDFDHDPFKTSQKQCIDSSTFQTPSNLSKHIKKANINRSETSESEEDQEVRLFITLEQRGKHLEDWTF